MPIRRERRRLYPADWERISLRIRGIRAGWRCEWTEPDGRRCEAVEGRPNPITGSTVRLAAAHLDHDETGRDPARIACLCQYHHLTHDAAHHRRNAAETRRQAMNTPDLFADLDVDAAAVPDAAD